MDANVKEQDFEAIVGDRLETEGSRSTPSAPR